MQHIILEMAPLKLPQSYDILELTAGFDAIITSDRNFLGRQNLAGRNIAVILLSTNIWPVIRTQPQTVQRAVANASPGTVTRATFRRAPRPGRPPAPTC